LEETKKQIEEKDLTIFKINLALKDTNSLVGQREAEIALLQQKITLS
jgi:hypothetical protein